MVEEAQINQLSLMHRLLRELSLAIVRMERTKRSWFTFQATASQKLPPTIEVAQSVATQKADYADDS